MAVPPSLRPVRGTCSPHFTRWEGPGHSNRTRLPGWGEADLQACSPWGVDHEPDSLALRPPAGGPGHPHGARCLGTTQTSEGLTPPHRCFEKTLFPSGRWPLLEKSQGCLPAAAA